MKTYLVTGGLGFLGAPLLRRLLANGYRVRVLDDLSRGSTRRIAEIQNDIELRNGDIRDWHTTEDAVRGVDAVIHLAFVNGTRFFYEKPAYVLDVGVKGMTNVLDACIKHGVGELILASSSEVYQTPPRFPTPESVALSVPDPLNPRYSYGGGKIISELMALNYGRQYFERVLLFRPHNVFGPDMGWEHVIPNFVSRLTEMTQVQTDMTFAVQGDGAQTRSFIYVDDFVDALECVLKSGQHLNIYNIGTENEIRIADLAQQIAAQMGLTIRLVPGPEASGGTSRRCPDTAKIRALGFAPKTPWTHSLQTTVEWYRQHPAPISHPGATNDRIFIR